VESALGVSSGKATNDNHPEAEKQQCQQTYEVHEISVQTLEPDQSEHQRGQNVDLPHKKDEAAHNGSQRPPQHHNQDRSHVHSPPLEPTDGLSDSDQSLLPPNWNVTTNSDGQVYYYNVLTKETSWQFPSTGSTASSSGTKTPPIEQSQDQGTADIVDIKNNSTVDNYSKSRHYVEVLSLDP
ncbi:hypothetical protein BGZ65_011252, partial [Modicella reniformis]